MLYVEWLCSKGVFTQASYFKRQVRSCSPSPTFGEYLKVRVVPEQVAVVACAVFYVQLDISTMIIERLKAFFSSYLFGRAGSVDEGYNRKTHSETLHKSSTETPSEVMSANDNDKTLDTMCRSNWVQDQSIRMRRGS